MDQIEVDLKAFNAKHPLFNDVQFVMERIHRVLVGDCYGQLPFQQAAALVESGYATIVHGQYGPEVQMTEDGVAYYDETYAEFLEEI